jgi:hypothetical protein
MWRRSWLTRLLCAGLLAVLLPILAGCNNPSTPTSGGNRPANPEKDETKQPPDGGGIKPPPHDPG